METDITKAPLPFNTFHQFHREKHSPQPNGARLTGIHHMSRALGSCWDNPVFIKLLWDLSNKVFLISLTHCLTWWGWIRDCKWPFKKMHGEHLSTPQSCLPKLPDCSSHPSIQSKNKKRQQNRLLKVSG